MGCEVLVVVVGEEKRVMINWLQRMVLATPLVPVHRLVGEDLCHFGQRVVRLEHGQRLGQELEGLVADQLAASGGCVTGGEGLAD